MADKQAMLVAFKIDMFLLNHAKGYSYIKYLV